MDTNKQIAIKNKNLYDKCMKDLSGLVFGRYDAEHKTYYVKLAVMAHKDTFAYWMNKNNIHGQ